MRRILKRKTDYRASFTPPIQEKAFWPGPGDNEGLSLSRKKSEAHPDFLDEWQFKAGCTIKDDNLRETCGVCAFFVEAARQMGLEVRPDPIVPGNPGHVILPQITYEKFENSVEGRREILILVGKLIELASHRILIAPGTPNPPKA
jgi:hypothetical protein